MIIKMDGKYYNLNLTNVSRFLQQWYDTNKHHLDRIETDNGKTIDFSRKSILRIGFKTAFMPIGLPALKMAYKMRGQELPRHEKHEDFIDYFMYHAFGLISLFDREFIYAESIESSKNNGRDIVTVLTHEPLSIGTSTTTGKEIATTEAYIPARGEALSSSGENWHGENQTDKRDYQEETDSTASTECLSHRYEEEG